MLTQLRPHFLAKYQERPYHDDSTASRLLSEVKHHRAWLVLRWGTTLESQVLFFLPPRAILGPLHRGFKYPLCMRSSFFIPSTQDTNAEASPICRAPWEGLRVMQTSPTPPRSPHLLEPTKGPSFHSTPMNFFDLPIFASVYCCARDNFRAHKQLKATSDLMNAAKKTGTTIP